MEYAPLSGIEKDVVWARVMFLADNPTPVPPWVVAGIYDPPDDDIVMDTMLGFAYIFYGYEEGDDEEEGVLDLLELQVVYRLEDRTIPSY